MQIAASGCRLTRLVLYVILIGFSSSSQAERAVLFFSQPPQRTAANLKFYTRRLQSPRDMLPLTGAYNLYDPENGRKLGKVNIPSVFYSTHGFEFRRRFPRQQNADAHYFLNFEGLNGRAEIRVNGRLLYRGSCNFLPLRLPCPAELLADSSNLLSVTVFPWSGGEGEIPRWLPVNLPRIDNGINRPVYLEIVPATRISALTVERDSAGVLLRAMLVCPRPLAGEWQIRARLLKNGRTIARASSGLTTDSTRQREALAVALPVAGLERWSPQNPAMYEIELSVLQNDGVQDRLRVPFAFRSRQTRGSFLELNGEQLRIEGMNYIYQDNRGIALLNRDLLLADLLKIREQGRNAIRVGFYPASPLLYELADSLGLLVFQDVPFTLLDRATMADSLSLLRLTDYASGLLELVRPHPSVVGLGLGICSLPAAEADGPLARLRTLLSDGGRFWVYACSLDPYTVNLPGSDLTFFELLKRNHPATALEKLDEGEKKDRPVFLSGLSKAISYRVDSTAITHDLQQITDLFRFTHQPDWNNRLAGNFLLTYSDYFLQTPALQAGPQNRFRLNSIGLYGLDRQLKKDAGDVFRPIARRRPVESWVLEKKSFGTFAFVLIGLINFLVFLTIYRSLLEFRQNIKRALRRPHGFFSDVQERRLIPLGESLFLILIISINGAIMVGSLLFFFRNNLYMDYLLSLLFPAPALKFWLCRLIWQPVLLVPVLATVFFFVLLLLALPIRITSLFREPYIRNRQAVAISAWAGAPFIFLLPFGMFFYNLLLLLNSFWILLFILLYFHVWYFLRWTNGTRVLAVLPYSRVLFFGLIFLALVGGGIFYYLQAKVNVSVHLEFIFHLFKALI